MSRSIVPLATAVAAALAIAAPAADAAAPSCSRGGAKLLAADGGTRVVSVAGRKQRGETRHERVYGCRAPTGRRFLLFVSRDVGLDSIERDRFTIVDQRYIGAIRNFEGGVSESQAATSWDARRRAKLHDTTPCDGDRGDFSGVDDAVFLPRGGIAYACNQLRIADAAGDRQLEPPGTDVRNLAVGSSTRGFNPRLYWLVVRPGSEQAKSLPLPR